jgi:hypothetical protein
MLNEEIIMSNFELTLICMFLLLCILGISLIIYDAKLEGYVHWNKDRFTFERKEINKQDGKI